MSYNLFIKMLAQVTTLMQTLIVCVQPCDEMKLLVQLLIL